MIADLTLHCRQLGHPLAGRLWQLRFWVLTQNGVTNRYWYLLDGLGDVMDQHACDPVFKRYQQADRVPASPT